MNKSKLVPGVFVGLTEGASLGVLLMPNKVSESRKKLSKNKFEFNDNLKMKYNVLGGKITDSLENLKTQK